MLKVIGTLILTLFVGFSTIQADAPISVEIATCVLEAPAKDPSIDKATIDLILKESAKQLTISYVDACAYYDKGDLTIGRMVTPTGQKAFSVVFGSCSLCVLEDDIF